MDETKLDRLSHGYTMNFEQCEEFTPNMQDIRNAYKDGYKYSFARHCKFSVVGHRIENTESLGNIIIAYCDTKEHAEIICELLNKSDWNTIFQFGVIDNLGIENE